MGMLNDLFPASEFYQIAPQFKHIAGSIDFTVIFLIMRRKVPVLFVELKTYIAYDMDSTHKDKMRDWVLDFTAGNIPIPKLYRLSVMKRIFYYHVNTIDIIGFIIGHVIMISEAYAYNYYRIPMDSRPSYKPM